MFCTRCGRQIDGEGKFCPFCGQPVGGPVNGNPLAGTVAGGVKRPGKRNKIAIFGGIGALAGLAVIVAVMVIVKPFGTDKTEDVRSGKASGESRKESKEKDDTKGKRNSDDSSDEPEKESEEEQKEAEEPSDKTGETESDTASEDSEEKVLEVLSAYQRFIDGDESQGYESYTLAYLDEDNIPELIANGDCEASGHGVITYHDGELTLNYVSRLGGINYVEKQNFYCNSNGNMGFYYDVFYRLEDGEQIEIASGIWGDKYDEEGNIVWNEAQDYPEQEYFWNDVPCSEEEYCQAVDDFIEASVGDAEFTHHSYWDDHYLNMLDAYEALQYKRYSAYWPQIEKFDLRNGVLTYTATEGGRYGWGSNDDLIFTISYPVAPDCVWENRSVGSSDDCQPQVGNTDYIQDTTYDQIKEWIDDEKKHYDEAVAELGRDEVWVDSPVNVEVVVKDGVVVRVYTVIS